MQHEWVCLNWAADGQPSQALVNTTMATSLPAPNRNLLLRISVPAKMRPEPGKLAHPDEVDTLDAIEDALVIAVELNLAAVYVVRLATPQGRQYHFYADSADGLQDLTGPAAETFDWPIHTESFPDPDARFYRDALGAIPAR